MMGVVRTDAELRALEIEDREKINCLEVRLACSAFFERRGLSISIPIEAPEWDHGWIEREFGDEIGPLRVL